MSIATINIDTATGECHLTVDGALVQADQISFYKGTDYDGNPVKSFEYMVQVSEPDGMMKKMMHTMVPKESPEYSKENAGLVNKEIKNKDKLYKEVEAFVNESSAAIKIVKNGPADKPFCMVQDGKTLMCHKTIKEAQDHMNKMMADKAKK